MILDWASVHNYQCPPISTIHYPALSQVFGRDRTPIDLYWLPYIKVMGGRLLTVRAESIWDIYGCMGYMGIYRISKRRMLVDCHLNPYIKSIGRMLVDCEGAGRQLLCSSKHSPARQPLSKDSSIFMKSQFTKGQLINSQFTKSQFTTIQRSIHLPNNLWVETRRQKVFFFNIHEK